MASRQRPLRSIIRTSRLGRRSSTRGSTGGDNHVDLLQLVDAQATACAALIEESHASMRELLQKSSHGGGVNTARFSERLGAQLEHLRVFLEEESGKLKQTIDRGETGRHDCRSWKEICFGRRSLDLAKGLGPEFGEGKQIWWSRQFRSNYLEYAYRQHHFEIWRPRVRVVAVICMIGVAYLTVATFMDRDPSPDALMWAPSPPPPACPLACPRPREASLLPHRPLSETLPPPPTVRDPTPCALCPRPGWTRALPIIISTFFAALCFSSRTLTARTCAALRPLAPLQPAYRRPARLGPRSGPGQAQVRPRSGPGQAQAAPPDS